jgi:hypothetical protein
MDKTHLYLALIIILLYKPEYFSAAFRICVLLRFVDTPNPGNKLLRNSFLHAQQQNIRIKHHRKQMLRCYLALDGDLHELEYHGPDRIKVKGKTVLDAVPEELELLDVVDPGMSERDDLLTDHCQLMLPLPLYAGPEHSHQYYTSLPPILQVRHRIPDNQIPLALFHYLLPPSPRIQHGD